MRWRRSRREERELLLEAFLGGWQAGLGAYVHPRAREMVEACFDRWLEEAADEVEIFGLPFRRRPELPERVPPRLRFDLTTGAALHREDPAAPALVVVRVPRQRRPRGTSSRGRDTRGGNVTAAAPER